MPRSWQGFFYIQALAKQNTPLIVPSLTISVLKLHRVTEVLTRTSREGMSFLRNRTNVLWHCLPGPLLRRRSACHTFPLFLMASGIIPWVAVEVAQRINFLLLITSNIGSRPTLVLKPGVVSAGFPSLRRRSLSRLSLTLLFIVTTPPLSYPHHAGARCGKRARVPS